MIAVGSAKELLHQRFNYLVVIAFVESIVFVIVYGYVIARNVAAKIFEVVVPL
jgi:hypothetical protein